MPIPVKRLTVHHTGPDFTMHSKFDYEFWLGYKPHLISLNQSPHTIRNKIQHAKRFGHVLNTQDARELLSLSKETRSHAMKALSALAKYHGKYDIWLELIKRFQLKWEQRDSLDIFKRIFDNNEGTYKYVNVGEELYSSIAVRTWEYNCVRHTDRFTTRRINQSLGPSQGRVY